jgi:hypothetical protein
MNEEELKKMLEAEDEYNRLVITPMEWGWVFRHEHRFVFLIMICIITAFGLQTIYGYNDDMNAIYGGLLGFAFAIIFVWHYYRRRFLVAPELPTYRSDLVTSIRQEAEEVMAAIMPIVETTGRVPFPIQIADVTNCRHITADIVYSMILGLNESINSGD